MHDLQGKEGDMLAAVYHGPNDLRVENVPIPEIGKDEILVKVLSASICGTDLRIYHGNHRMYPPGTVRIPATAGRPGNVIPISDCVDPAVAALVEPFACVLRGQNALHIEAGEVVLIMGAGPIGVMHIKLAKARGAGRIIVSEPVPDRADQAERMGAHRVVDPGSGMLKAAPDGAR